MKKRLKVLKMMIISGNRIFPFVHSSRLAVENLKR